MAFEVMRSATAMRRRAASLRRDGLRVCLVPTMGYLHEGHLSLLRAGRARSDVLLASIFVNPTQFGPTEDLDTYPRDEQGDLHKLRSCGVDLVFIPTADDLYRPGHQTIVHVPQLAKPLCGTSRPTHFAGVATIVTKLFHLTFPQVAIFGEKDFQQLAVIRRLVLDLNFAIEIVGMPIVREPDGVAMSSRNAYLTTTQRQQATCLHHGLKAAQARFSGGEHSAEVLLAAARAVVDATPLARLDYLELRDARTLETVDTINGPAVMAMAVFFGNTRLIDNVQLHP